MNIVSDSNKFRERYAKLNEAQKQAVDTIDGPVMVIAGPGTGKTELLSMRAANILKQTDTLAENILCLTFTESGAEAMRERLIGLMGRDAYHVAIHTFHSFGNEVIGKYSDYFYNGANFRPADDLSTYEILYDIFSKLPHSNPLSSKLNDDFSQLKNVQNTISDFKRSGLTPDEVQKVIKANQDFIEYAEPLIQAFFDRPIHKSMIPELEKLYEDIASYISTPLNVAHFLPLADIFLASLRHMIDEAVSTQKTTALTAWRNQWFEKDNKGKFIFKDRARAQKLLAASFIYNEYLNAMRNAELYDYDDMILRLVHALEVFPDLKYNLQEQYQYIMVDEFQDTNGAQLRILLSLTDNPAQAGRPNILVVGDDDQAIYSFQGAEVSNILTFQNQFERPIIITLRENYRSAPVILNHARSVIGLGTERLESILEDIDKTPQPIVKEKGSKVTLAEYETAADEYSAVAETIAKRIADGQDPRSIAVLARSHKDIKRFLPYIVHRQVPVNYEHQENILEQPPVKVLIDLARIIEWITRGDIKHLDAHLPELLMHPAWKLSPQEVWRLSLKSYHERQSWLETMQQTEGLFQNIASFLIEAAYQSAHQPLDITLDQLFGNRSITDNEDKEFYAPFKNYFFSPQKLTDNASEYLTFLNGLSRLRELLRDFRPYEALTLQSFVTFVDMSKKAKLNLTLTTDSDSETQAVRIMTAHKAKGLEFDSVFIINSTDQTWGSKSRGRQNRLSYPENIPIAPPGGTEDERIRLFFVAMTRAKHFLFISYAKEDFSGKSCVKANFLETDSWESLQPEKPSRVNSQLEAALSAWQETITTQSTDLKTALDPHLRKYQLSPTHLNTFIDVTCGGPQAFLLQNLLHFPTSPLPNAALGSAVHATLKKAHIDFTNTKEPRPIEDIVYDFEKQLRTQRLNEQDFTYQLQKGSEALAAYLEEKYPHFTPDHIAERDFRAQGAMIGDAHLTGIIDAMHVNKADKTISIIDYKTGKPALSWKGSSDFEKIKLHKYRQQLMFYKLLIEHSRDYKNYKIEEAKLEFIEPTVEGEVRSLSLEFDPDELERFTQLIQAVWRHIKSAQFIDTSAYEQSYKGIIAFEDDLLK